MSACHGNGEGHCCHLGAHGVCQYLEESTVSGRRWACGLFRELDSWPAVHSDERYLSNIKPKLRAAGIREDCGNWPDDERRATEPGKWLCCYGTEQEVTVGNAS